MIVYQFRDRFWAEPGHSHFFVDNFNSSVFKLENLDLLSGDRSPLRGRRDLKDKPLKRDRMVLVNDPRFFQTEDSVEF